MDTTFAQGGVFTLTPGTDAAGLAAGLASNGDIVISGQADTNSGWQVVTVALTPSGSLDQTFGSSGIAKFAGEGINALTIDSSGRIYLAGVGATIVRLNRNGSIDTTFGSGGVGFYCDSNKCAANGIALQPSQGDILLAGATEIDNTYEILALLVFP